MLDIRFIRENPEAVEEALKNRHAKWDYDEFRRLDAERREIIQKVESLKAELIDRAQIEAYSGGFTMMTWILAGAATVLVVCGIGLSVRRRRTR